jgi:superfamily II DNA or RNA helicase
MATGLGKAVLFAALRQSYGFERRVMVLVHREELAKQAAEKIHRWNPGLMIGIEMATSYAAPMDSFVVASVPTLGRRGSKRIEVFHPEEFDCIVSDEAHHVVSPQWKRVLDHFGLLQNQNHQCLSLGLTATPNRADGTGLRECFDEIVFDMGIDAGIRDGYLVDLRCWRVETTTGLDQVHTTAGDLNQGELADAVNTPERNLTIVKAWAKHAWDKRTLVFTVNVQHALDMAEAFKSLGIPAAAVWGEDPDRADKLKRMRNGELTVLCNCAVLTEGYDDPGIECVVLARPTKSALLLTQMIGRGTRLPDGFGNISEVGPNGKQNCCILDVADVTGKHRICSVPSLLGLPKNLDMKGETYRKVKGQLERVAEDFPTANLVDLKDLSKLDSITKQIELFQVKYPVEIKTLTELAWRQQGDGYWLPTEHGRLTLSKDLREEWWVRGTVSGKPIDIHAQNLAGAFNSADRAVLEAGGNKAFYARDARWRDIAPSEKQISLCRKLRLDIPAGATRGMVSAALDQHFAKRRA